MTDIREKVARGIAEEACRVNGIRAFALHAPIPPHYYRYADRILAIPEIAQALSLVVIGPMSPEIIRPA